MRKFILKTTLFLISLTGFSQSFTELVSYNSTTSDAFDGISADCTIGIKITTGQGGIYIDHHLQNFNLKTLRIAQKDIPASQVPSYAILDKRVDVTFDLYVNNVFIERYGQPSVSWARLQGLPNSDNYKPDTSTNGYKLFNSGAISVRNVKITKLNYRVKEDYYMQIRNEIAGKSNKSTTENPVKQGNSTSLTIENNSSNNNPTTQTGTTNTGIPVNTSGNDPLEHFETDSKVKSNPITNYNNTPLSNNTTTQLINSASTLINQWADQEQANNEAEEIRQLHRVENEQRIAAEAAAIKAKKLKLIAARKELITKMPDGKTPLSYEAKEVSEVYFFVYSYNKNTLEDSKPLIYISNVFSIQKYSDGSWPFKTNIMEEIARKNKNPDLKLSGYYNDKIKAEEQQQLFVKATSNYDFNVESISYTPKKVAEKDTNTDYWGNTTKKEEQKTTTQKPKQQESTSNADVDYWGNPIKKETQKVKQEQPATTTKNKVDFWGNPIK